MGLYPKFNRIATRTWLYSPEKKVDGQLVVICTWLGALPKHISKYITIYQAVAPGARILLIESEVSILVSSYARQKRCIRPSVDVVLETLAECPGQYGDNLPVDTLGSEEGGPAQPKIHLHSFSNGGTNTLTQLLISLNGFLDRPLPVTGLLLDSSPMKGTYWKDYNAMVLSIPPSSRFFGAVVVHFLLVLLHLWIACGNENPASLMRRTILDDYVVHRPLDVEKDGSGEGREKGSICYLYSKADRMTDWTDVRDHAEEAREKGWNVHEVLFEDSGHCSHLSKNEDRYIAAVRMMWAKGTAAEDGKVLKSKL